MLVNGNGGAAACFRFWRRRAQLPLHAAFPFSSICFVASLPIFVEQQYDL